MAIVAFKEMQGKSNSFVVAVVSLLLVLGGPFKVLVQLIEKIAEQRMPYNTV